MSAMRYLPLGLVTAAMLSGCATNEVDPLRVSTWDLLAGNDRLQRHLEQRRQENDAVLRRAKALEKQLNRQKEELASLQQSIAGARSSQTSQEAELRGLRQELAAKQGELEAFQQRLHTLRQKAAAAENELQQKQPSAAAREKLHAQVEAEKMEIIDLEQKTAVLKQHVERTIRSRIAQHLKHQL